MCWWRHKEREQDLARELRSHLELEAAERQENGLSAEEAESPYNNLHQHLLPLLGIPLGELWNLGPLAADCAADGRYTFFVTSAPLNIRGGVSSTAAAIAIK